METRKYPQHVGIIPDGNRRYAREHGISNRAAYAKSVKVIDDISNWLLRETPVKYLTIYGLSTENILRANRELADLFSIYEKEFLRIAEDADVHRNKIKVQVIGFTELLPKAVQKAIGIAERRTAKYTDRVMTIALGYGGREELIRAIKNIAKDVSNGLNINEIDEHLVKENLYTNGMPYPDVIIRTKEHRLSNFLTWQSAYSELIFIDKYFPELTIGDIDASLREYDQRERRYGK